MKTLLCRLIAQAPECHISHDHREEWYHATKLAQQAATAEDLLWILMHQYNSAVEPQASMYRRVERIHETALRRKRRRSVAESIAMYRSMRRAPTPDHVFYKEITEALNADMEAERAALYAIETPSETQWARLHELDMALGY